MRTLACCSLAFAGCFAASAQTVVFESDFDSAPLPAELTPGVALQTGVQGFAGLGPAGNQFTDSFLRSPTGNMVQLALTNLPPHTAITIQFLFAAIDSVDGTGTTPPQGDFFRVTLDGGEVFFESFANALESQIQSYDAPDGAVLARRVDLGFTVGTFYLDSAYDMSLEPSFRMIPHSGAVATITFEITGVGIQDLNDESWAFDNLRVIVGPLCPPDFNLDGVVDGVDLAALLAAWSDGRGVTDLSGDSQVDGVDLAALLAAWGACPE